MKLFKFAALALLTASPVAAQVVDGQNTGGNEYAGGSSETILTDSTAPDSNFQAPTNSATAGYTINLLDTNGSLYGLITQTGGTSAGPFANLYFDIDPTTGTGGSELGIEVANNRGFVAGTSDYFSLAGLINSTSTTVNGLTTFEFSIANSVFLDFIAGAAAQGYFGANGYTPQDVRLNLSQSLGYSVAGGPSTGTDRLGTFSVAAVAAVPEPGTWAMMLIGFGAMGVALRRRRRAQGLLQAG